MALGKAFIEVHADTKPFARELGTELNKILQAAEKDVRKSAGKVGETIATEAGKGVDKNKNKLGDSVKKAIQSGFGDDLFGKFTKGIIDSLDDGLSGLPAEVKVALGAALVAISPLIGAAITALLNTTVIAAFAGLGVLVASQFQAVQDRWAVFVSQLRELFVGSGQSLVDPVLRALDMIQERLFALRGWFQEIFAASAQLIEPLTAAFLGFVEGLLPGLLNTLRNVGATVGQLEGGFRNLGRVIGQALDVISSSQYADDAFNDLILVIGSTILAAAGLLRILTEVYGRLRDISLLLSGPQGWAELFASNAADDYAEKTKNAADANGLFEQSLNNLIAPTEDEAKAMEALNQQISKLQQLTLASVNNSIAWEQAIDDFTASVRENGRSLDITTQAGRNNARSLIELANAALRTRQDQIALTGDVNAAQTAFEAQRAKIYQLAAQMGLSKTRTEELVGALLSIPPPKNTGVTQATITNLLRAISLAKGLGSALGAAAGIAIQVGAGRAYADGGIVTSPHIGLVGEAGPEAIIPLNNPARAQQLMAESGLSSLASPNINVYIGNEQIDAYIDDRVNQRFAVTARSLAYGGRGI